MQMLKPATSFPGQRAGLAPQLVSLLPSSSTSSLSSTSSSSTSSSLLQSRNKMIFNYQAQATLTTLLQDFLVDLCREHLPFNAQLEIDGVVSLSDGKDVSRQMVLKVHHSLPPVTAGKSPWLPQRPEAEKEAERAWPRGADLPPKEHVPSLPSLPSKPTDLSRSSWPINTKGGGAPVASNNGSLSKQGSLYGADAPQDLSLKEPSKSGSASTAGVAPLHALATSVEKAPFGSYTINAVNKPAALQLVNKMVPGTAGQTTPKVVSLLYQKIMEGPKVLSQANQQMWKAAQEKPKLSPQNLAAVEASRERQNSPGSEQSKDEDGKHEEEEDDDPALHQGEMLCKICSETVFGGFYGLQNHTYEVHRRYVCKKCYSTFSLRCNLRRHERLHEGLKPYSCDTCDKTFSRSTDLRMHMAKHGNVAKSPGAAVACDKCTKTFTNVQNLRWHMFKVHKAQDEIWACTICEKLFHDKDDFLKHRESHTASLNQYQDAKRPRLEEDSSADGMNDDEVAMKDEYQQDLKAIDEEAINLSANEEGNNTETSNHSLDDAKRPSNNAAFTAIKEALKIEGALLPNGTSNAGSSSRNKRKRKGNPIKHVGNASESDEEMYDLSAANLLKAETMNASGTPASPAPSGDGENDPLQRSFNSDVLASSSMSRFSHISEQEQAEPLQSLQALTYIPSPLLVIEPKDDGVSSSPLAFPKSSEMLYSPHCNSPLSQSPLTLNNNVEDLSMSAGKMTPDRKFDPVEHGSLLTPVDDGDDDKEYTCTYDGCSDICHGFRSYETHFISVHSRYPCKLCKQTFSGKNNRTRHMRNHNRAKIYPCPDCGKYFSRPDSMREHRFIHTASYQEDKCRRCNQEFSRKSLLLAHLKNCFRSARTKNGSIDESPYMYKDGKREITTGAGVDGSLMESPVLRAPIELGPSTPGDVRLMGLPLILPKLEMVQENNNEAIKAATKNVMEAVQKQQQPICSPAEESQEEEEGSGGDLVIDTSAADAGAEEPAAAQITA